MFAHRGAYQRCRDDAGDDDVGGGDGGDGGSSDGDGGGPSLCSFKREPHLGIHSR